jgi:hypothetical protein
LIDAALWRSLKSIKQEGFSVNTLNPLWCIVHGASNLAEFERQARNPMQSERVVPVFGC